MSKHFSIEELEEIKEAKRFDRRLHRIIDQLIETMQENERLKRAAGTIA